MKTLMGIQPVTAMESGIRPARAGGTPVYIPPSRRLNPSEVGKRRIYWDRRDPRIAVALGIRSRTPTFREQAMAAIIVCYAIAIGVAVITICG